MIISLRLKSVEFPDNNRVLPNNTMQTNENIIRDILRLLVWYPFRWLLSIIPVKWGFLMFKMMGDLHFYASSGKKKRTSSNLEAVLGTGQKAALEITKKTYENHYIDRLHICYYPKLTSKEKIARYVHIENIDLVDRELKKGRGILLVQPHFGPVQITLLAMALYGYNPIQIGYPTDRGLSRIGRTVAYKNRQKYEALLPPILPANKYLGRAYRHLKNGGVVFTTGDGAGRGIALGEQRQLEFLGIRRMFPMGPAIWALRTNAAFIPTFIITERYDQFRIVFEEPVEGIHNDIEKDVVYLTEKFISVAESYVKKYPYCWHFWDEI